MKHYLLLLVVLILSGCQTTGSAPADTSAQFKEHAKDNAPLGIVKFDTWTAGKIAEFKGTGAAFGLLGALVESAADKSSESFALNLQNATLKLVTDKMKSKNSNFINVDIIEKYGIARLTRDIKSNRMWGWSSIDKADLGAFFEHNKDAQYAIHIQTKAFEVFGTMTVKTWFLVYDKDLQLAYKFKDKQKADYDKKFDDKQVFEQIMSMQSKIVDGFFKSLDLQ